MGISHGISRLFSLSVNWDSRAAVPVLSGVYASLGTQGSFKPCSRRSPINIGKEGESQPCSFSQSCSEGNSTVSSDMENHRTAWVGRDFPPLPLF